MTILDFKKARCFGKEKAMLCLWGNGTKIIKETVLNKIVEF